MDMTIYDETDYDVKWFKKKMQKSEFFRRLSITEQSIVLCCCKKYGDCGFYIDNYIPRKRKLEVIESLLKDGTSMKNLWERFVLVAQRSRQFGLNVVMAALKNGESDGPVNNNK